MKKIVCSIVDNLGWRSFLANEISYEVFPYFQFYGEYDAQLQKYIGTLICPSLIFKLNTSSSIVQNEHVIVFPKINGKSLKTINIGDFIFDVKNFTLQHLSAHIVGFDKKSIVVYGKNLPVLKHIDVNYDFFNLLPEKIQILIDEKRKILPRTIESIISDSETIQKLEYFVERGLQ